jgi:hypothetical protein
VVGTCGYGEGLSGSINAGNFLTSCKIYWLASQEGLPDLDALRNRITAAVNSVTEDTLRRVWDEFSYRVDVVRAAGGGHIEHL